LEYSRQLQAHGVIIRPAGPWSEDMSERTDADLVADDEGDDLTEEERHDLHEALSASWKSAEAGHLRPAAAILDELRRRR
jgi:hypothetical protein